MGNRRFIGPLVLWAVLIILVIGVWAEVGQKNVATIFTIMSTLVALLPILKVGPMRWTAPVGRSTPTQVDEALVTLANEVRIQWDEESRRRRLQESRRMPVRWEVEERPPRSPEEPDQLPNLGQLPQLIRDFTAHPRPMVVLGEPGSGKTGLALILTLELLKDVKRARVPVLLKVNSWNPSRNLDDWLTERLLEDYPFLGREDRFGGDAARQMVSARRIIPIFDGLDEIPADLRAGALAGIEADWSSGDPFLLTCRTNEFFQAHGLERLSEVLVVRLLPLAASDAASYLLEAAPDTGLAQWEPVLDHLVENPDGPLARTLTLPLMLFLARTVYEPGERSPNELLDTARFPDTTTIQAYLLDNFIPTVFATRPPRDLPSPSRTARQWSPAEAERSLTFLARHLSDLGTADLAWWQLQRQVPPRYFHAIRTVIGTLGCGLLGFGIFGLFGRPLLGVAIGAGVGFGGAALVTSAGERRPRRFVPRILRRSELAGDYLIRDIGFAVVGALTGGLITGIIFGFGYGLLIGLVFGVVFGLSRRFTEPTESKEPVSPMGMLRDDRMTVVYALLLGGTTGGVVGVFLGGVVGAGDRGLIFDLTPLQQSLLGGAGGILLGAAGLAMLVHSTSAWGRFLATRMWLSRNRQTPARLMTFLEDSSKLGVLRQVGGLYQFRHMLLQERLAQRAAKPGPPAP